MLNAVIPWVYSVKKLKNMLWENTIDYQRPFVTGDKDLIYKIVKASYFVDEDFKKPQDENEFIYTEFFFS